MSYVWLFDLMCHIFKFVFFFEVFIKSKKWVKYVMIRVDHRRKLNFLFLLFKSKLSKEHVKETLYTLREAIIIQNRQKLGNHLTGGGGAKDFTWFVPT